MLLTTAFFPPIEYFALLAEYSVVYLEGCEHYQKQSWRNRCRILSAAGPQDLRVPVVHEGGSISLPIKEIRVDYSTPWLVRFERSLDAAYRSSPWFDYYRDDLYALLDTRPGTLWSLNLRITAWLCEKIGLGTVLRETDTYLPPVLSAPGGQDFRAVIHPKRPNTILRDRGLDRPYYQVFSDRFGFVPGLSVADLLFNEGPDTISHLRP